MHADVRHVCRDERLQALKDDFKSIGQSKTDASEEVANANAPDDENKSSFE